jgi:peptide deformylase
VDKIDEKIKVLVEDMIETMHEADGVGLAAVQVGILKRVIVYDIYDDTGAKALINPEIIEESGEQIDVEGCLSLPNRNGEVLRPKKVVVKGMDIKGNNVEIVAEDLLARVFCHEIDHLNGILFIDKVLEEEE